MKNKTRTILILLGVLILSGIILYFSNQNSNEEISLGENATLYISNGCPHCTTQLKILGECSKNLTIIDCTEEPNKCLEDEIRHVPTWIINNEKYEGIKSIEELKELINSCE